MLFSGDVVIKSMINTASIPNEINALKDFTHNLILRNQQLEEMLLYFKGQRFGASSESLNSDQLGLFDSEKDSIEETEIIKETPVSSHIRKKKSGRCSFSEDLKIIEIKHDISEEEKICSCNGQQKKCIGEERSREIKYIPATVEVIEHVRLKYACPACENGVSIAELPPKLLPKTMSTPSLLTHLIISKYFDALPLYRQERIFQRIGIDLNRATMSNWLLAVGEKLQPIVNLILERLTSYSYLQMDETPFQVLKEEGRTAWQKSYIWVIRGGPPNKRMVFYYYDPRRSSVTPKLLLSDFKGYLQCDGHSAYKVLDADPNISIVACMAHIRRKFYDAIQAGLKTKRKSKVACQMLKYIKELYQIEKDIKELSADEIHQIRQSKSKSIMELMKNKADEEIVKIAPGSLTSKALRYMANHWKFMLRYLDDGQIAIDNNQIENAIRPFVIGRKNWLFSNTAKGAITTGNFYTLIETAKANNLEPSRYLETVLEKLPHAKTVSDFENLLPFNITLE